MRRLQYRFYRKPMATDLVTDYHSAHSLNSKIATITQDVYRIMSNCSPETTLPGIKFTSEIREVFSDEWGQPTLDTVMKMEEKGEVVGRMRRLQYRFYRKPMATDLVTDYHSAHSLNSKIATLTQDVYRIISSCSPETELEERKAHLEKFTRRLRLSHYPPSISAKMISNGIVTNKRALEREARKERNRHRLGEEGLVERRLRKVSLKEN